jgi:hypothetical protein
VVRRDGSRRLAHTLYDRDVAGANLAFLTYRKV